MLCNYQRLVGATALALVLGSPAAAAPAKPVRISIAEARLLPLESIVTIEGVVTVPSGAFTSSFDDKGFAIQDRSGGMYVSIVDDLKLRTGGRVQVTGKLVDSPARLRMLQSTGNSVLLRGRGSQPEARPIQAAALSEKNLGTLVTVSGTANEPLVNIKPYGFRMMLDDSSGKAMVYVSTSTNISESELQGNRVEVTGFVGQFNGQYQVWPRFPADLRIRRSR